MQIVINLISLLYFGAYVLGGQLLSAIVFHKENSIIRLWLGGVIALAQLLWLPALFSFSLGFAVLSQLLALALVIVQCIVSLIILKRNDNKLGPVKLHKKAAFTLLPLLALGFYLMLTHTIPNIDGALHVGQSTFGDLAMHLGFITSISEQTAFPPQYSIYPGIQIGYPFLCDSISSTFYTLGASLRFSVILPAIFAYSLVLLGIYLFFEEWLKVDNTVVLATLLFFVGGGFGFAYFFDLTKVSPVNFSRIFSAFYQTPTNNVEFGIKWVNPIADMLIPQRATLFGWALLFPCLYMLRRAAFNRETEWFIPLGIIAGCLPLVHTHSFLALGLLSAFYLLNDIIKKEPKKTITGWLYYGLIAIALAAPQLLLFTFKQSSGFLKPFWNWANETDNYIWFYIKNLGLIFILAPLAFMRLDKSEKVFYGGALVIWVFAELILFQPNPYDNNKLLFVSYALTCGIIAKLLIDVYAMMKGFKGRSYIASLALALLFVSGILTLGREGVSDYELIGNDEVQAAEFIKKNTETNSLFLTATNHNNAVAALTGRNILCGSSSYLYFHGIDYSSREQEVRLLYEQPYDYFDILTSKYGIDYVWVSNAELYNYECDLQYYSQLSVIYENDSVKIYDVK